MLRNSLHKVDAANVVLLEVTPVRSQSIDIRPALMAQLLHYIVVRIYHSETGVCRSRAVRPYPTSFGTAARPSSLDRSRTRKPSDDLGFSDLLNCGKHTRVNVPAAQGRGE